MTYDPRPLALGAYFPDEGAAQTPADAAVVITTILRPSIERALESVFAQTGVGRIQVLIGIDKPKRPDESLRDLLAGRPRHVSVIALHMPFSTSTRHGGVHGAADGGALRTILSFMANSRYVAYLDDDNVWEPDHLSSLLEVIDGKSWAHTLRMLVDENTGADLGIDEWDAVGVDRGRFAERGGFVDPNCLMIDKVRTSRPLGRWSEGPGVESDRSVFEAIRDLPHGRVERATVRYGLRKENILRRLMPGRPQGT